VDPLGRPDVHTLLKKWLLAERRRPIHGGIYGLALSSANIRATATRSAGRNSNRLDVTTGLQTECLNTRINYRLGSDRPCMNEQGPAQIVVGEIEAADSEVM